MQHQDFWEKLQRLERDVAYREVQKRGWCSYTELNCLLNSVQLIAIAQTLINVSSICLATYAAGLITLVGSTLIGHFIVQSCLPGTSLSSEQSANLQTNFMSTDLIDVSINTRSQEIKNDNLSISSSLIQDENVDYSIKTNEDIIGWQWWLNSIMTWLPEYCILENDVEFTNSTKKMYIINNNKFSFNSTQAMKIRKMEKIDKMKNFAPEDYRRNVNWKEALGNIIVSIRLIVGNDRVNSIMKVVQSSMSLNIYY